MSERDRRQKAKRRNARGFSLREDIPGRPWTAATSRLANALQFEDDPELWIAKNTTQRPPQGEDP